MTQIPRLADDRLTTEEWKKLRMFSKDRLDMIAQRGLDHFRSRMQSNEPL